MIINYKMFGYGKYKFNEVKRPPSEFFVCCCISTVLFQMFPYGNNIIAGSTATYLEVRDNKFAFYNYRSRLGKLDSLNEE
jgi:hypothetical protein